MMGTDRCKLQAALIVLSLLLWKVQDTQQQIVSRYFAEALVVDVAAITDPLKVTWANVSTNSRCSAYCVQRKCACVAFSFVNGTCHMFANVLSGPSGTDKGFNKRTECAAAKVLPFTRVLSYTGCSATYTCSYGYEPQTTDSSKLTCTADETWAPSGYRCGLIPCQQPPSIENGNYQVTTLEVGTHAVYMCSADYTNRGGTVDVLTCQFGGTWSSTTDVICKLTNVYYTITIQTGISTSGGTDAEVFVRLYGEYGDTKITFYDSGDYSFEEGDIERKSGTYFNVGPLNYIEVGHDDTGIGPGWRCDWVSVVIDGQTYDLDVYTWIEDSPYYTTVYV